MDALGWVLELSFPRPAGSDAERRAAELVALWLSEMGLHPRREGFEFIAFDVGEAFLELPDGGQVPALPVGLSADGDVTAEIAIVDAPKPKLAEKDAVRGRIAFLSHLPRYEWVEFLCDAGAAACVIAVPDQKADVALTLSQGTARDFGERIPIITVPYSDAVALVNNGVRRVTVHSRQRRFWAASENIIADVAGETDEVVLVCAHYDSVPSSPGAQDNAAGVATVLEVASRLASAKPRRTIRFALFGAEEMGLLGSKAYVRAHIDELARIALVVNVDVGGDPFAPTKARVLGDDQLAQLVRGEMLGRGYPVEVEQDIYSSDGMPFARYGVPSVSFAKAGTNPVGHSALDAASGVAQEALLKVADAVCALVEVVANARILPFEKTIPDELRKKVEEYFSQRR